MFAADCPTKRAAFMTDMTPGRWSHVHACTHHATARYQSILDATSF